MWTAHPSPLLVEYQLGAGEVYNLVNTNSRCIETSGGFRNFERGVQPLACEAQPKILGCHAHFRSRKTSELNISKQLWPSQTSGDQ